VLGDGGTDQVDDVGGADAPLGPQDVNLFRVLVEHGEHPQGPADVIPEIRAA